MVPGVAEASVVLKVAVVVGVAAAVSCRSQQFDKFLARLCKFRENWVVVLLVMLHWKQRGDNTKLLTMVIIITIIFAVVIISSIIIISIIIIMKILQLLVEVLL